MRTTLLKWLKRTGIVLGSLLLLLFLLPLLFPGKIESSIKQWINQSVNARIEFRKVKLSFFEQFPTLTLSLHDFTLTGATPFEKDTLMAGQSLSFGINLRSLFRSEMEVDQFFINKARVKVLVDEKGNANYAIYRGAEQADSTLQQPSGGTSLQIRGIYFSDCSLYYRDASIPMTIQSERFDYEGKGLLDQEEFDLTSSLHTEALSFEYDGTTYLNQRSIDAELITGINTYSLAFRFQKNNVLINQLPVDFTGTLFFVRDGYDIDLRVVSGTTDFANVFSVFPPEYASWFRDTRFSGQSRVTLDLRGSYRASTGEAPDMHISCRVKDGSLQHKKAPEPLKNLQIAADIYLPKLNTDSLLIQLDTLSFTLRKEPTKLKLKWLGMQAPNLDALVDTRMDLGLLDQAIGLQSADLKGLLSLSAKVQGVYQTGQNPANIRPDTILLSVPAYQLKASIKNGSFQYATLPLAIKDVQADIESSLEGNQWKDIRFRMQSLKATPGTGNLEGRLDLQGLMPARIDANLQAKLLLQELAQIFPMDGYAFSGNLQLNLVSKGTYHPSQKQFPVSTATIDWDKGFVKTPFATEALQQIKTKATISSKTASYKDLSILIQPLDFEFNKRPFSLTAALQNLDDLHYAIKATGSLQLDSIYQMLGIAGYKFGGELSMQLDLQGKESDLRNKRYQLLNNRGYLEASGIHLQTREYPAPFYLPQARLEFNREHAWLKNARLQYKNQDFQLNGDLQQFIGYLLGQSELAGNLSITGNKLVVDDFMAFDTNPATDSSATEGVVLLPADIRFRIAGKFDTLVYGQSVLHQLNTQLELEKGRLLINRSTARLAGAMLNITASYAPENPVSARFEAKLKADSFDVQKAYQDLAIFREMAPGAAYAKGIISADYSLNGRLNEKMEPVYPSLKGKGKLVLEQVQVKGLRLFSAVSRATGKDSINNPNLKAVTIQSSIQNNLLTIERTKMRIFGFRPRLEGQVSLDGRLNLRFRLGLPPLGILGIPMTITGSSDNPLVKIRKGKEEDELEEVQDETSPAPQQQ